MARVRILSKATKQRSKIHEEVEATYSVFNNLVGEKYIQIDTFGTKHREVEGFPSQMIQFNKETAMEIINILKNEFNI